MYAVVKFYHVIRSGISFKANETVIELWHSNSFGSDDDNKSSTTISLCNDDDDDDDVEEVNESADSNNINVTSFTNQDIFDCFDDDDDKDRGLSHGSTKRAADEGSDENDSLLVDYDVASVVSLWFKKDV